MKSKRELKAGRQGTLKNKAKSGAAANGLDLLSEELRAEYEE
jgi:hypothetical protein